MADDEPAIETIASGKYAMIDFWGARDARGTISSAKTIAASRMRISRRTSVARAFARRTAAGFDWPRADGQPKLLILDEPCAGLDPAAREHFCRFLQRLGTRKNSPTLVLVTHHVEEIMPVFSHLLVLKDGKVLAGGKKSSALNSKFCRRAFGAKGETAIKVETPFDGRAIEKQRDNLKIGTATRRPSQKFTPPPEAARFLAPSRKVFGLDDFKDLRRNDFAQ